MKIYTKMHLNYSIASVKHNYNGIIFMYLLEKLLKETTSIF